MPEDTVTLRAETIAGVAAALACAAERGADPADAFWRTWMARDADAATRMEHMDEYMRGRMLASVYDLLLIEDEAEEERFLDFEIGNHDAYGAVSAMYRELLACLATAVLDACGEDRDPAWPGAFARRNELLIDAIEGVTGGRDGARES